LAPQGKAINASTELSTGGTTTNFVCERLNPGPKKERHNGHSQSAHRLESLAADEV
jgi:hypothetical protein